MIDFQEKTELQEDHSEITDDNVLFRQPFLLSPEFGTNLNTHCYQMHSKHEKMKCDKSYSYPGNTNDILPVKTEGCTAK